MESKLPKPSAFKRPMPVTRTMLPMDRTTNGFGSKNSVLLSNSTASLYTFQPLTRDLTNMPSALNINPRGMCDLNYLCMYKFLDLRYFVLFLERAASPEAARSNTHSRVKLRRSRSACEIRDMKPLKRMEPTLAPIPAKTSRLMSTTGSASNKPPRIGTNNIVSVNNAVKRTAGQTPKSTTSRTVAVGQTKKPTAAATSSKTSVSTTGAGKPINKRIPPYDFKARYNDLLEKYKVLKEKYEEKCDQFGTLESLPEQLEDTQNRLITTQEELKNTLTTKGCLEGQVKLQREKIETVESSLFNTKDELDKLAIVYNVSIPT